MTPENAIWPLLASEPAEHSRPLVSSLWPFLVVMCHFKPGSSVSTLDIEPLVRFAAIQYALVASHLLCQVVQSLNKSQTQFLALLVFGNSDIFDMTYKTKIVNELSLDDHGTCANDDVLAVADYQDIVGVVA